MSAYVLVKFESCSLGAAAVAALLYITVWHSCSATTITVAGKPVSAFLRGQVKCEKCKKIVV